jgi:hypothetical protein
MNTAKPAIKISVRNLVEFILRCGDIDQAFPSKRAAEGTRVHQKFRNTERNYEIEVFVKHTIERDDFTLF